MFDRIIAEINKPQPSAEKEREMRTGDTQQLIHDIVGKHAEFFADPENRLEFIKGQSAKDFFMMSQYINAKLRGGKPYEMRRQKEEWRGGSLPLLHTPKSSEKPMAFKRGYDAVQEYMATTSDSTEKQIEGVAMATEALFIWVHPFTDGNGRTSRFIAKMIEEGATDIESLTKEVVSGDDRRSYYKIKYETREGELADANNDDLILDNEEREAMRKKAETLPSDIEGMYLSIKALLENDEIRQRSAEFRQNFTKVK